MIDGQPVLLSGYLNIPKGANGTEKTIEFTDYLLGVKPHEITVTFEKEVGFLEEELFKSECLLLGVVELREGEIQIVASAVVSRDMALHNRIKIREVSKISSDGPSLDEALEATLKEPERLVFIGGEYERQTLTLNYIENCVRKMRKFPVVVSNYKGFGDPRGLSLRLLHLCGRAIFDVTFIGGQLIEIERAGDYGVNTLIVKSRSQTGEERPTSAMMQSSHGPFYYSDVTELEDIIRKFLN